MITFEICVKRFKDRKDIKTSFLSKEEAKYLLNNLTPTSKKYILMKREDIEKEYGGKSKIPTELYKAWRDALIAEVCGIELNDPQIRLFHKMCPAEKIGRI